MREEMHMASPPPYPDTGDDTGAKSDRGSPTGTRWGMLLIWIIVIALVLLVLALHLTGAMGPGLHDGH
jgi:hypothetical protein